MTLRTTVIVAGAVAIAGVIVVAGGALLSYRALRSGSQSTPTIVVQTDYTGASAQVVASTLAASIEQQVNGVEDMVAMSSLSAQDGSYRLTVTFEPGTDLDQAQARVQERVGLALPVLPDAVRQRGLTVRKQQAFPTLFIGCSSPGGAYDGLYLSNYARLRVVDELARVPGVADVILFGQQRMVVRVGLDIGKLTGHQLTVLDVLNAIREQQIDVTGDSTPVDTSREHGQVSLICHTTDLLAAVQALSDLVVKVSEASGSLVKLADVATIEPERCGSGLVSINSAPAVVIGISLVPGAQPGEVSLAVANKVTELQAAAPQEVSLSIVGDFTSPGASLAQPATREHLVVDLDFPDKQKSDIVARAAGLSGKIPGVTQVLAFDHHPFRLAPERGCMIAQFASAQQRDEIAKQLRETLHNNLPGTAVQVSFPSQTRGHPVYGYPVEFIVEDRGQHGDRALGQLAAAVVERLQGSGQFVEPMVGGSSHTVPALAYIIDREQCRLRGVTAEDVQELLKLQPGVEDITKLQLSNREGALVPLVSVASAYLEAAPVSIERHNLYNAIRITANLADGVSLSAAKATCEAVVKEESNGQTFGLVWQR